MTSKDNKTNLKADHGAHNQMQAGKRGLLLSLVTCQQANAKPIATNVHSSYHSHTTKHSAAKPSRHSLAIFVSKTDLTNNQQVTTGTDENVISSNRYTYDIGHSVVSYGGMSEPNKIPLVGNKFRGLNAVVVIPFYPFFMIDNKHTKHSGGHHHA